MTRPEIKRNCILCWDEITAAMGFTSARDTIEWCESPLPIAERKLPKELCGMCGILFMTEFRSLFNEPILPEYKELTQQANRIREGIREEAFGSIV